MTYIKNIVLRNKKNKVETIDKILLSSKKIRYAVLADFSKDPLLLKNYEKKIIPLEPVTAWVGNIKEKDIEQTTSTDLYTGYKTIINTITKGTHPKFYFAPYNYLYKERKIPKILAVDSGKTIPIKLDWRKDNLQSVFPIRNTEHPSNEYQEKRAIYDPRLILATELTLGRSASGKEPDNKEIKVLLYNNEKKLSFDSYVDGENILHDFTGFSEISTVETRDFEKKWEKYYNNAKEKHKKFITKMERLEKKNKKNKEKTFPYTKTLEDSFHNQTARLLRKPDLPKISSEITSKIFFLRTVEKFAEYPIVNKRHTLFATAFYSTEEIHPCFEEEVEKITFSKIWRKIFRKTSPTP